MPVDLRISIDAGEPWKRRKRQLAENVKTAIGEYEETFGFKYTPREIIRDKVTGKEVTVVGGRRTITKI